MVYCIVTIYLLKALILLHNKLFLKGFLCVIFASLVNNIAAKFGSTSFVSAFMKGKLWKNIISLFKSVYSFNVVKTGQFVRCFLSYPTEHTNADNIFQP